MPPRPTASARGYGAKWQRTRRRYLREHPICEHADCNAPSLDVHHIDGKGPLAPRGHDETNLQALCHSHHSQLTAAQTTGGIRLKPRKRATPPHPGALG